MASKGKRGGAGERVLEGRHVIGLFMLMLLFSGVFFTLGYVMGRNQYDGQVRAATNPNFSSGDIDVKPDVTSKHNNGGRNVSVDVGASANDVPKASSDWDFYNAGKDVAPSGELKASSQPVEAPVSAPSKVVGSPAAPVAKTPKGKDKVAAKTVAAKTLSVPVMTKGAFTLQVAALRKQSDALALASGLQKKKFPAFVLTPLSDKYYRVQVGPYGDQKSAETAKKGLEGAGFKAIVKH